MVSEEDFIGVLVARYPRLFRGKQPRVMSYVPDGWQKLVDLLLADLDGMLTDEQAKRFKIEQIKEKFAGLRVYWKLGKEVTAVIDVIGPTVTRIQQRPRLVSTLFDQIGNRVQIAEEEAARTCQECGSLGGVRRSGGWLITLCDSCNALLLAGKLSWQMPSTPEEPMR